MYVPRTSPDDFIRSNETPEDLTAELVSSAAVNTAYLSSSHNDSPILYIFQHV